MKMASCTSSSKVLLPPLAFATRRGSMICAISPRIAWIEFVTGDLFAHETVVWLVVIESFDDVVAIAPDIGPRGVGLEPVAIRVACHIQPMASPAFAIGRRGE